MSLDVIGTTTVAATPPRPRKAYKILTPDEWAGWLGGGAAPPSIRGGEGATDKQQSHEHHAGDDRAFAGSALDGRDGFIHLSTWAQVGPTYERFFEGAGAPRVVLAELRLERVLKQGGRKIEIRWEKAGGRAGGEFPHVYDGGLAMGAVDAWAELASKEELGAWLGERKESGTAGKKGLGGILDSFKR